MKENCKRGEPVNCGSKIRLKHLTTGCHLHSHLFAAPLTKENQVTVFWGCFISFSLCEQIFHKRENKK